LSDILKDLENCIDEPVSLDERAIKARESDVEAKALIEEFMPFLHGRVAKYSVRFDEHVREDMLSVAMMAFYEAVQCFASDKGHFFPFANRVVCSRLIDNVRKINRHLGMTVSLDDEDEERVLAKSNAINVISMRNYDEDRRRGRLAEEIEQFKSEIATWGITMDALVKSSPKHKELRKTYKEIVAAVADSEAIMQKIHLKRYFPVIEISKITGLPQKKLERARIYILASLVIRTGDYELLSEYLEDRRPG